MLLFFQAQPCSPPLPIHPLNCHDHIPTPMESSYNQAYATFFTLLLLVLSFPTYRTTDNFPFSFAYRPTINPVAGMCVSHASQAYRQHQPHGTPAHSNSHTHCPLNPLMTFLQQRFLLHHNAIIHIAHPFSHTHSSISDGSNRPSFTIIIHPCI